MKQDAKSRLSGAGSIDKLRINLNPPKADFADAQPAAYGFVVRFRIKQQVDNGNKK
jgi:hypothetical protein